MYICIIEILNSGMDNLLESILSTWKEHKVTIMSVKDILMYMDRTYVQHHKKLTIYNLSLKIFRETIVYHPGNYYYFYIFN